VRQALVKGTQAQIFTEEFLAIPQISIYGDMFVAVGSKQERRWALKPSGYGIAGQLFP